MPIPEYPESTPPDSRWCWYTVVEETWRAIDPTLLSQRVQAVLAANNILWNEERPDVAIGVANDPPVIYFNADVDPSPLFEGLAEPPPTSAESAAEQARTRLLSFRDGTYAGDTVVILRDLVTVLYPPGGG